MTERIRLMALCICAVYVIVQITSSEHMLGVEISNFEVMYNSTIQFGNYCCCDDPDFSKCVETPETLEECPTACDLYFHLYFNHCPPNEKCSVLSDSIDFSFESIFQISPFILQVPYNLSNLELYNQVRICNYTISNGAAIEIHYMGGQNIKRKLVHCFPD